MRAKTYMADLLTLRFSGRLFAAVILCATIARAQTSPNPPSAQKPVGSAPTVAEAERFIAQAETRLLDLWIKGGRASWVGENFITDDTEAISANPKHAPTSPTPQLANDPKP